MPNDLGSGTNRRTMPTCLNALLHINAVSACIVSRSQLKMPDGLEDSHRLLQTPKD